MSAYTSILTVIDTGHHSFTAGNYVTGKGEWGKILGSPQHGSENRLLCRPKRQQDGFAPPDAQQDGSGSVLLYWGLCPECPGGRCYARDRSASVTLLL